MRYWIYWNDLVQGPFEMDELVSLHAFSEDLLVCLEGRLDWLPANRVAELAPSIELLKARSCPPPSPPPPTRPPSVTPLQGEFFETSPGQQDLFADFSHDPDGLFSYRPAAGDETPPASDATAAVTMPFRFVGSAIETRVAPSPKDRVPFEILEEPRVDYVPPPAKKESPVPLEIVEEELPPVQQAAPAPEPIQILLPLELEPASTRRWQLLPWIVGVFVFLGLLGSFSYWLMDRSTSRSAIAEASWHLAVKSPSQKPLPPRWGKAGIGVAAVEQDPPPSPSPTRGEGIFGIGSKPPAVSPAPAPPVVPIPPRAKPKPRRRSTVQAPIRSAAPTPVTDPWIGRQADAINIVMNHRLFNGKRTIGSHAKVLLDEMHEKELLHAADTGERLFLPDKLSWSSLREEGSYYRVYLNFSAQRLTGERVQTNSYQFRVDLQNQDVMSDDSATRQDFLQALPPAHHAVKPLANDIESILSAVDLLNKQKLRGLIASKSRHKQERKNIQAATGAAQAKVDRAILYFRTRYPEKMLQNVAKAYLFSALLNPRGQK